MNARSRVLAAIMITAACWQPLHAADLVKVVNADGRESQLLQKLITVKDISRIYREPNDDAKVVRVGPFNIFFQVKTDSGKLQENGFYRVTTSTENKDNPNACFWVKPEDVQVWASRFAIKPRQIDQKTTFTVDLDAGGTARFTPESIPADATAYSFVLNGSQNDTDEFNVALCIARIEDDGTAASLNQLGEMSLEICFVLEDDSYLNEDFKKEGKPFKRYIEDLGESWVNEVSQLSAAGNVPVRMGLIVFSDTHPFDEIRYNKPTVLMPMTSPSDWLQALRRFQPTEGGYGDIPNDGYSALDLALTNAGWSENSAKHVVFLGNAPLNPLRRNEGTERDLPIRSKMNWLYDRSDPLKFHAGRWDNMFGTNTSGKSSRDIIASAYSVGGNVGNELRRNRYLHMIHVGMTTEQYLGADKMKRISEAKTEVDRILADRNPREVAELYLSIDDPNLRSFLRAVWLIPAWAEYDKIAQETMQGIAQSQSYQGYYSHMDPETGDVERVSTELGQRINEAIRLISDVASGKEEEALGGREDRENELTRPIFTIVGSTLSQSELIKTPVRRGTAKLRDEATGRSVGEQVVMVSEDELRRLAGTLNSLYESFERRRRAADRQDVNDVLADLQASLAQAASGQEITAETQLDSLITDLPLRTEALRLSAGDIAVMSTDAFDSWLESVSDAEKSIEALLTGDPSRWIAINAAALNRPGTPSAQYSFLRLSELP